jgi:hypothetical protein
MGATLRRIIAIIATLAVASCTAQPVFAHDVYKDVRSKGGQLCCGGDPKTGDCEGVEQYEILPSGDARIYSNRYGAWILIGKDKITWLPILEEGEVKHPAHYCGVPRTKVFLAPFTDDNPDKAYWTYCAFIADGGV